jgi:hypothetical protein
LVKTLKEAINRSPAELKAMGLRGRKLVADKYDIKAVSNSMTAMYKLILK